MSTLFISFCGSRLYIYTNVGLFSRCDDTTCVYGVPLQASVHGHLCVYVYE